MERRAGGRDSVNRAMRQHEAIEGVVNAADDRYAHISDLRNRLEKTLKRGTLMRHGREVGLNPAARQRRIAEMERLNAKLTKRSS